MAGDSFVRMGQRERRRRDKQQQQPTYLASVAVVERLDVLLVSSFDGHKRPFSVMAHIGLLTR